MHCIIPWILEYHGLSLQIELYSMNGEFFCFLEFIFIFRGNDGTMQGAAIVPEKRIIITI